MENKEKCKIVKDLLPSYIDGLTSEETQKYIETHLEECNECKETLENMKKDFEKEKKDITNKSIKYAKKINKRIKSLLLIILIFILFIFAYFVRNAVIILSLNSKAKELSNVELNNYHIIWTTSTYEEVIRFDIYYKDGLYKRILYNFTPKNDCEYSKYTEYVNKNGKVVSIYENEKTYRIDEKYNLEPMSPQNFTHIEMMVDGPTNFIYHCLNNIITKEKANGEDAYRFKLLFDNDKAMFINKSTGITAKSKSGISYNGKIFDTNSDVICEFNCVTDEDVTVPNLDGYILEENITK